MTGFRFQWSPLLILAALSLGCFPDRSRGPSGYSVQLSMRLGCGKRLDGEVGWGRERIRFGNVSNEGGGTCSPYFRKPPETVTVSWTENGQSHSITGKTTMEQRMDYRTIDTFIIAVFPGPEANVHTYRYDEGGNRSLADFQREAEFFANGHPVVCAAFKNATSHDLVNVNISLGKNPLFCSILRQRSVNHPKYGWGNKGWTAGCAYPFAIDSEEATISWQEKDSGKSHKRSLTLSGILEKDLTYQTLCFIILDNDRVEFQLKPWGTFQEWKMDKYYGHE